MDVGCRSFVEVLDAIYINDHDDDTIAEANYYVHDVYDEPFHYDMEEVDEDSICRMVFKQNFTYHL